MNYTFSERTVKKYTVKQALNAAEVRLREKHVRGTCINAIRRYDMDDTLTLQELNELVDQIVEDSIFYEIK